MRWTRGLAWLVAALALLAALAFALRAQLATRLMRAAAARVVAADPIAELPDGLHLWLCGAGSPLPDPRRSGPCVAVALGRRLFVVDAGSAAARNLAALGLRPNRVAAVFLTHFHSDHIDGLGELALQRWAGGSHAQPLPLVGPTGVESVARGFNQAYRLDAGYRVAHHGEAIVPPSGAGLEARAFEPPVAGREVVVWEEDDIRVTAFRVEHEPVEPAVGYRFDHAGRSLVISGDTRASPEIARIAAGADLLVHEALAPQLVAILTDALSQSGQTARARITRDILDYHASPVEAARTAEEAGVRHLLLYHVVPPLVVPGIEAAFLEGVSSAYGGGVTLGRDGVRITLPRDSQAILVSGD